MSTVFYSWQSNRPETRKYIRTILEGAIKDLNKDSANLLDSPRLDSDTKGVNGAPDIIHTILTKIENANIFVADVSIIGKLPNGRSVVNQNVAYELGYACGRLGEDKIILVFDKTSGDATSLPFDIRNRRLLFCDSTENTGRLRAEVADIIKDMLNVSNGGRPKLDEVEMAVLELYAHMGGARSVNMCKTLGGILPAYDYLSSGSEDVRKKFENIESGELLATLNDMADRDILAVEIVGRDNHRKYSLAKEGYRLIRGLNIGQRR